MRRLWPLLLLLLGLLPAMAQAEPVTLRVSWWGGNDIHRATLAALERFEQRYPEIKVKAEYTGWAGYLERMTTQIAGGTAPDVMQINWNWIELFSHDGRGFYDLNTLNTVIALDNFSRDAIEMSTRQGRLNALAPAMSARLFWFNKTTWDKAGVPLPRSWDELFAAGPLFQQRLGDDWYPLDLNFQDLTALAATWLMQRTGRPLIDEQGRRLAASREDLVAIADFYRRLVDQHVVPSARLRASYGNVQRHELRPWINGQFAGHFEWSSAINKSADNLAPGQELVLGPYPMLPGARDAGLMYKPGVMFAIGKDTPHAREAGLLLQFLLNDAEGVRILGTRRGVPDSRAAVEVLRADGAAGSLAWQGAQQIRALPHALRLSGWYEHPRVRDGFNDIFERQGYGVIDAEQAGAEMESQINTFLRRVMH